MYNNSYYGVKSSRLYNSSYCEFKSSRFKLTIWKAVQLTVPIPPFVSFSSIMLDRAAYCEFLSASLGVEGSLCFVICPHLVLNGQWVKSSVVN